MKCLSAAGGEGITDLLEVSDIIVRMISVLQPTGGAALKYHNTTWHDSIGNTHSEPWAQIHMNNKSIREYNAAPLWANGREAA